MYSKHAKVRSQQRGIPPLIALWLFDFGELQHDGHGGVCRYFTKTSIRRMEREFGREPLRRLSEFLDCYLVEATDSGAVITVGHRFGHIRRK